MQGVYTILLLIVSNIFMTCAWYGHLKMKQQFSWFEHLPLIGVILFSWFLAFFEYCCQVPANRLGFRRSVQSDSAEGDSGGDYTGGVCGFQHDCLQGGVVQVESCVGIPVPGGGCLFSLQEIVRGARRRRSQVPPPGGTSESPDRA